ncbi:hypothetical protein Scep_005686 [Stephania cephalantha]|uniref:AMP deaminase n=1 Tax=Stephania cephalantha TaxID=152367 RepID=A0AAP0PWL9_9MAGN
MDSYALHMAFAALVGASFMAVSAYYMHRRTFTQILEFAKSMERERERKTDDGDDAESGGDSPRLRSRRRRGRSCAGQMSRSSLPDFAQIEAQVNALRSGSGAVSMSMDDRLFLIPQVCRDYASFLKCNGLTKKPAIIGEGAGHESSFKRAEHLMRSTSPKSPLGSAGASFYKSDVEDDEVDADNVDARYTNRDTDFPNDIDANMEQHPVVAASMTRSHSVSGDLHGVQPDPVAADILRKEPEHETFVRAEFVGIVFRLLALNCLKCFFLFQIKVGLGDPSPDDVDVYRVLQDCLRLREKYVYREEAAPWEKEVITDPSTPRPNPNPFLYTSEKKSDHYFQMEDGVVQVYANKNSKEKLFPVADATTFFTDLHRILRVKDAGNVRSLCHWRLKLLKCRFNIHLMLNADGEFLAQKSAPHRDFYNVRKVVIFRDGTYLTLKEVFESLDLTGYDLNVDLLDVHADKSTFHRFDKFNLKYNPCGQSRLREIFLKQDNLIQGRFLGELTKEVFSDLAASKYQMAEYRISIYGRKQSEWDQLASWIVNNGLYSENVVWLIQLPRLYNVYKEMGIVTSFQNILDNVFLPLFEVTVDPDSHPQLHVFLKQVVGFDLVDDESKPERRPTKHMPTPAQWTNTFNPAFSYYVYYCYANLYTLNKIGLAMSPLSNNSLFLDYHKNPFKKFFRRGLNVSLSTDDPLQIQLTKEPLVEEYSVAASVWKLSSCDLCEIARNSVYQSGFSHALKSHWIGKSYYKRGHDGNDIHKTNVPHIRLEFRHELWREEMQQVYLGKANIPSEIDS